MLRILGLLFADFGTIFVIYVSKIINLAFLHLNRYKQKIRKSEYSIKSVKQKGHTSFFWYDLFYLSF